MRDLSPNRQILMVKKIFQEVRKKLLELQEEKKSRISKYIEAVKSKN